MLCAHPQCLLQTLWVYTFRSITSDHWLIVISLNLLLHHVMLNNQVYHVVIIMMMCSNTKLNLQERSRCPILHIHSSWPELDCHNLGTLAKIWASLGQVGYDLGQESCPRTFCWYLHVGPTNLCTFVCLKLILTWRVNKYVYNPEVAKRICHQS